MSFPRFAVHRPVLTIMVTLIVVLLGVVSLMRLPIDLLPDVTYPVLSVSTSYENASPEEIEEMVTRPLEQALAAVPGVEDIISTSATGSSNVRLMFSWGTDLTEATNDVRDRLDRVIPRLPDNADRPVLRKFDLSAIPVMILGASSNLDPVQLRTILEDQVRYRIERLDGVASLDIWGGLEREIQVNLLPSKMKAFNISPDVIVSAIRAGNINLPAGNIDRGNYEITIRTPGEFTDIEQLADTVVAIRDGVPVRLRHVAETEDKWSRIRRISRVDGRPGVRMAVSKQSGTNTVHVAELARNEIQRINEDIPQIHIATIVDSSKYIRRSISNVSQAAIAGGVLAVFILLIFLRNIRSTVVIAAAIPISIIATFALIYFGGFTLNIMTLGGLALGIGMLVDNSIVVLENIHRLREEGEGGMEAAANGSEEVTSAIVASTLTTLVVFLPMIFLEGMAGVMFTQLALVVMFSLLCSLVVAITLVPTLAARLLRPPVETGRLTLKQRVFRASGAVLEGLERLYKRVLHVSLDNRFSVIIAAAVLLASVVMLLPGVGVELMPVSDEGEVRVEMEMEVGTRLALAEKYMLDIEQRVVNAVPEIESMVLNVGGGLRMGGVGGGHTGEMRISLVPLAERKRSSEDVANQLRGMLTDIPGATIRVRTGQGMGGRMASSDERLTIEIRGYELDIGEQLAAQIKEAIEGVDGITDVIISRESGVPEEQIVPDRQRAEDLRLSVLKVANTLQTALGGSNAGYFRESGKEYPILVKFADAERLDINDVLDIEVINADGVPVALRNVTTTKPRMGPMFIERKNQERIITVSANTTERDLGSIAADVRAQLAEIPVPRNFTISFGGDLEEQQEVFTELAFSLVLALALVYMVMASQFESLRDPFVVMFSVPLAAIGVIGILFVTGTTFNMQAFIGCIMLGGIVVNNAILLVDHTNLLRRRDGMALREAIEEAGKRRLRPILMTALTTMLGLMPLALGLGEGGEAQAPMARAVIGGLLSSTLITLVFVPVMYSLFERKIKHSKAPEGV